MPSDRTVLEHLQGGRDALVSEVERLTTAIHELDGVIARLGGAELTAPAPSASVVQAAETPAPAARKAPAKKAAARRATGATGPRNSARSGRSTQADGGKSIRIHVLEMLGSEERDFGLAEIIDRIHAQGIQAHDDAVRSITIKLMKDGRVERVGRGQYRLAGGARAAAPAEAAPQAPEAQEQPPQDAPAQAPTGGYVPPVDFNADPSY